MDLVPGHLPGKWKLGTCDMIKTFHYLHRETERPCMLWKKKNMIFWILFVPRFDWFNIWEARIQDTIQNTGRKKTDFLSYRSLQPSETRFIIQGALCTEFFFKDSILLEDEGHEIEKWIIERFCLIASCSPTSLGIGKEEETPLIFLPLAPLVIVTVGSYCLWHF